MKTISKFLKSGGLLFVLLCVSVLMNHRQGYITLIGIFSILVICSITLRNKIDVGSITILYYVITYILFSSLNRFYYSPSTLVLYAIAPFTFYQFGAQIPKLFRSENAILTTWLIIIFCYSLDIFGVTIANIIDRGQITNASRTFSLDEGGMSILSATLVGLPMNIAMVGLPMFILIKNRILKFGYLIVFLLALLTTFSLLNRTGIVVAILCFVVVIGYRSRKNLSILLSATIGIGVIILLLFYFDVINTELLDLYNERNEDLSTMGTRTERWSIAFPNLLKHPFGWAPNGEIYYVHNMWLDIARISGIFPFIILVYMAVDSFRKAYSLIKYKETELSYLLFGLNICFFSSCFLEPIYGGTHFMLYCLLWGVENTLFLILKRSDK